MPFSFNSHLQPQFHNILLQSLIILYVGFCHCFENFIELRVWDLQFILANSLVLHPSPCQNVFNAREKELRDMHERMLIAVAAKYGKRKSECKSPARKTVPTV